MKQIRKNQFVEKKIQENYYISAQRKDLWKGDNMQKFIDKLLVISSKFAQLKFLNIIQGSFMMIMPVTIVGSLVALLRGLPIDAWQAFLASSGLYTTLSTLYTFTVGFLSVYVVFSIGYQYAVRNGLDRQAIAIGFFSLASFFIVTPYTPGEGPYGAATFTSDWTGATGMFCAIIIAFLTGWIFKLCKKGNITIKLPDQVPPGVANQFTAQIPGALVLLVMMVLGMVVAKTPYGNIQSLIYGVISMPIQNLGANIWGQYFLSLFIGLLWFLGIHGGLAGMPVMMLLFTQLQYENLAAYQAGAALPNWVTGSALSISNGSLPLIVAMLLFAKAESNKTISRIAVLPALFGVDEPAYFGYPMILNPIFFIPWTIANCTVTCWGTYLLQALHLLPYYNGVSAGGGFMPFFITNLTGYGISGMFWGFVLFAILVLICTPFVKAYDKQKLEEEKAQLEANLK